MTAAFFILRCYSKLQIVFNFMPDQELEITLNGNCIVFIYQNANAENETESLP
jgi:hypothetical protein